MHKQQDKFKATATIVPFQKLQKFYKFFGIQSKQYPYIECRQCIQSKSKAPFVAYSSQSLIKLLRAMQQNSQQFLQILALNTTVTKSSKKQFMIDRILRQHSYFSFSDMLRLLIEIRNVKRDKQLFTDMLDFIKIILQKAKYLLYKFCQTLVMVQGQCLNFYIRKRQIKKQYNYKKEQNPAYQYSLVIGMDNIMISFCSSNQFCENIFQGLLVNLKQVCSISGYDIDDKEFTLEKIQSADNNIFEFQDIPEYFLEMFADKEKDVKELIIKKNLSESYYTSLVLNTLVKYAEDIFYFIENTIVFLSNLVLQKKQLKNIAYDEQFISMKHPLKDQSVRQTFMNLYCEHFQGIPQQLYRNGQSCPFCSQLILVDQVKCYQRNRNVFQNLLSNNYLNPLTDNIIYYFRDKIFSLATKQKFSSYPHFCQYIKTRQHIRDRPEVLMILNSQRISLYNKLWGKKKLFNSSQLIATPVRGKYCRHLQFFQLLRVYETYLARNQFQSSFECFLCMQPIEYNEIMYLHQIKLLIDAIKQNFYSQQQCNLSVYIQIDHQNQIVEACSELEKGYMKRGFKLPIYQTLMDPLTKSEKDEQQKKQKKNQQQEDGNEFEYTDQFSNFFFGF